MSPSRALFTPFARQAEEFTVDAGLAARAGLAAWAGQFALGTAGYRDLLDPDDLFNLEVPFNGLTMAIVLEARAQLAREAGMQSLHVGGEVRPHTQEFIDLAARLYAAHRLRVHLRPVSERTTPIWLSSFGVFYEELDGGENFTASHSPSYKGGWKPMEASGGQLLAMAGRIAERVRVLVGQAMAGPLVIRLAGSDDPHIHRDFDPVEPYLDSLRQVVPAPLLGEVPPAGQAGFRAAFCTEGGSMGAAARRIFAGLGLGVGRGQPVFLTHEQESSTYHGIGTVDGVNHGVDPGKWQVYKHVGAQDLLREGACHAFFIWDPDGDRFNMVTVAPAALAEPAAQAGLEVDPLDQDRCLVFFKPNQIYFMLTALKLSCLQEAGQLAHYDWIVATTFPTSLSIGEIATTFNARGAGRLSTFRVPVGFKHFAALVSDLEAHLARPGAGPAGATDVTGTTVTFGDRPRLLIMAEESGGAAMGPAEPLPSRHGRRSSLAPKEKDAMQIGVMALCLAARLFRTGGSFAGYYLELLRQYDCKYRFYERRDVTLFDETLTGPARTQAQADGNRRKQATVRFFRELEGLSGKEAAARLQAALPAVLPAVLPAGLSGPPRGASLPKIRRVFWAGDGTMVEFSEQWFQLRASGTDAVLRYYMEGREKSRVQDLNEAFTRLELS